MKRKGTIAGWIRAASLAYGASDLGALERNRYMINRSSLQLLIDMVFLENRYSLFRIMR
jgi:hypothetical protein